MKSRTPSYWAVRRDRSPIYWSKKPFFIYAISWESDVELFSYVSCHFLIHAYIPNSLRNGMRFSGRRLKVLLFFLNKPFSALPLIFTYESNDPGSMTSAGLKSLLYERTYFNMWDYLVQHVLSLRHEKWNWIRNPLFLDQSPLCPIFTDSIPGTDLLSNSPTRKPSHTSRYSTLVLSNFSNWGILISYTLPTDSLLYIEYCIEFAEECESWSIHIEGKKKDQEKEKYYFFTYPISWFTCGSL